MRQQPTAVLHDEKLMAFMTRQFLVEFDGVDVRPETDLFAAGYIDSFGFVEMISFIEAEYAVKFTDEDLLNRRMNSLEGLLRVIEEKQSHAA